MDVHEWHTNTPMYETEEDKEFNKKLPKIQTRDPESGVVGSNLKFQRLTFVCYFREKIEKCEESKTLEYYKREGFDEKEEKKKAKLNPVATLPIPGYTGTLEEAIHAITHTPAGASARLAQTKKQRREKDNTRKNRKNQ